MKNHKLLEIRDLNIGGYGLSVCRLPIIPAQAKKKWPEVDCQKCLRKKK